MPDLVCPICGKGESETFVAPDGEAGGRAVSHLQCAVAANALAASFARGWEDSNARAEKFRTGLWSESEQLMDMWRTVAASPKWQMKETAPNCYSFVYTEKEDVQVPDLTVQKLLAANRKLSRRYQRAEAALDEQMKHPNGKQDRTINAYYTRAKEAEAEAERLRAAADRLLSFAETAAFEAAEESEKSSSCLTIGSAEDLARYLAPMIGREMKAGDHVLELHEVLAEARAESDETRKWAEELDARFEQIVATAEKLCNMKSATWMPGAQQTADELQALLQRRAPDESETE